MAKAAIQEDFIELPVSGDKIYWRDKIYGKDYVEIINAGIFSSDGTISFGNILYTLPNFTDKVVLKTGKEGIASRSYVEGLELKDVTLLFNKLSDRFKRLFGDDSQDPKKV